MYRLRAKVEIAADETRGVDRSVARRRTAGAGLGSPIRGCRRWAGAAMAPRRRRAPAVADEAACDAPSWRWACPDPPDWGSDKTYPIEANFDLLNGIDFKKGCFVGQETTSRMKRRGQIKSRMLPIAFEGPPPAPGAEVLAGELARRRGDLGRRGPGHGAAAARPRARAQSLTVDGRPVAVERPAWFLEALGVEAA